MFNGSKFENRKLLVPPCVLFICLLNKGSLDLRVARIICYYDAASAHDLDWLCC